MSVDLPRSDMVGVTRDALVTLRAVLFRGAGASAAAYLQEAGYAGGGALFHAFGRWSAARGAGVPESMDAAEFERRATEFFIELGWGAMAVGRLNDAVMTLDSANWAESDPGSALEFPGCYLSAGMLADFFGRLAGTPLAVMEVECRSMGSPRCRFLLGSSETIQYVYDGITTGIPYESSVGGMD